MKILNFRTFAPYVVGVIGVAFTVIALMVLNRYTNGKTQQWQWLPWAMLFALMVGIWIAKIRPGNSWFDYAFWGFIYSLMCGMFASLYLKYVGTIRDLNSYAYHVRENAAHFVTIVSETLVIGGLIADKGFVEQKKSIFGSIRASLEKFVGRFGRNSRQPEKLNAQTVTIITSIVSAIAAIAVAFIQSGTKVGHN